MALSFNLAEKVIAQFCGEFTKEAQVPFYKAMPTTLGGFARVKLRHRSPTPVSVSLSEDVDDKKASSLWLQASPVVPETEEGMSVYRVYIPDGYKYVYVPNVQSLELEIQRRLNEFAKNPWNDRQQFGIGAPNFASEVWFYGVSHIYAQRVPK